MISRKQIKSLAIELGWQLLVFASFSFPLAAQEEIQQQPDRSDPSPTKIDIDPKIIQDSPVLQKWIEQVPTVAEDIASDPSFRTIFKLGYAHFPSSNDVGGLDVGLEDVFLGRSQLTLSADYQASFNGDRASVGGNLHYYLLPLGGYVNIAPVLGYRYLETGDFTADGVNLGAKIIFALSRNGGADFSLTQSFISPGSNEEVGITSFSVGFAVSSSLRLSTDLQKQNSSEAKDSSVGINLEWML